VARRRRRLTWLEALLLVAAVNCLLVVSAASLVRLTDPERFTDLATGLWWAVTTITTVGYGDVVPASGPGRIVAGTLMFVGVGSFAFLTALAASVIVVGEVGAEEHIIEEEELAIRQTQDEILVRLADISDRLERLERRNAHSTEHVPDGGRRHGRRR
jgi:voltage-gated potassium channel